MCGLTGIMNGTKRAYYNDDFLTQGFTTSMLRGEDSSGLATINPNKLEYELHKLPIAGNFFAKDSTTELLVREANAEKTINIGHVRAATVGKVNYSNAHPFVVEHEDRILIGAHNGTLQHWKSKKGASSFEVDSEWALWRIACEGADAFEEFSGAFAFVWWKDTNPNTLCMARNSERPLSIVFLEDGGMAWASEAWLLFGLLERNRIKMTSKVMSLDEDTLYEFPVGDASNFKKSKLPKATTYLTGSGYNYSHNTNTRYTLTTVDKVQAIIDKAKSNVTNTVASGVTKAEHDLAENLGYLGERVLFDPFGYHSDGYIEGLANGDGVEFESIIKADCEKFSWVHTWDCSVIGARTSETSGEIILVLSAPSRTITALSPVNQEDEE